MILHLADNGLEDSGAEYGREEMLLLQLGEQVQDVEVVIERQIFQFQVHDCEIGEAVFNKQILGVGTSAELSDEPHILYNLRNTILMVTSVKID
jgi:hypothetical protein